MFIILIYDAKENRVQRFHRACKKYLTWVQLSVFEGYLSPAKLEKLKLELSRILNPEEDSVIIYQFRTKKYFSREVMGVEKGNPDELFF